MDKDNLVKSAVLDLLFLVIILLWNSCSSGPDPVRFTKLTCDYYENPVGIENQKPAFSWIIEADEKIKSQSAYQIIVASSPQKIDNDNADIWDSGKVTSDRSVFNDYEGNHQLMPLKKYWWKVRIWDQDGKISDWSPLQFFETGLMHKENWNGAEYIALTVDNRKSEFRYRGVKTDRMAVPEQKTSYPAGYFRKEFNLNGRVEMARLYISALGYHEAYLNGEKTGSNVLDPSATSYNHITYYLIHDVSDLIKKGANVIGLILGNGFYGQNLAFNHPNLSYGTPAVKIMLKIRYDNGKEETIISDDTWKVNTGPIVFDNVYAGETYDARYERKGWLLSGFDDSEWQKITKAKPVVGKLLSQLMPPIKKTGMLEPVRIFKGANGNWIVDFGQNISGWVQIRVNEKHGHRIKLTLAEALTRSGNSIHNGSVGHFATGVLQEEVYICKGNGIELWEPRFAYHGFQFAEISGLTEKPSKNDFKAIVVHTDLDEAGYFESSSDLLNQMAEVSKRTVLGNVHGFPEDCPHREKCGWLGDAQVVAEYCLYHFNMSAFYNKYMLDIRSNLLTVKSNVTNKYYQVPTMVAPGKRAIGEAKLDWGIAGIYIPWYNYLHNGDFGLIKRHYSEMKGLVEFYLTFKNQDGIIENGLGDWCPPRWDRENNPDAMECHPFISSSAYFYDILGVMQHMAIKMEDEDYIKFLTTEKGKLLKAFNQQYLQKIGDEHGKWYGSQTATVLALQFGMVNDSILNEVVEGLKYDILVNKNKHHSTGIHGNRYIYSVLSDLGEEQLACELLTTPGFPSQAYIINCGLNTWPERQWEWDSGIEWDRSLNHPMHSGFAAYFYETIAGIRPMVETPGFKEFKIEPVFPAGLKYAKASVHTPYGFVVVNWHKKENSTGIQINVPFNTLAHVKLPVENFLKIRANGIPFEKQNESKSLLLDAGNYEIEFQ